MAQLNIRIDDDVKEQAERLFVELGMNFSTAVNVFIKQALRQGGLPFAVTTETDPFYNPANMNRLAHSINQMEHGQTIRKTIAELERMADE
jgi:DNA-damage-inducible protein J